MPAGAVQPAPEWTMHDDTTPITAEMVSRYRYANSQGIDSGWLWVYVQHGRQYTVEQTQGYYQNIALVAALIGGFAMSTILAPSFEAQDGDAHTLYVSISGTAIFALLFGCVLDCILIENSLRGIPDDKYLLDFLKTEKVLLALPFWLFVSGILLVFSNIAIVMKIIYGLIPMICCFGGFASVTLLILRRYMLLSAKVTRYAYWGMMEVEKAAANMPGPN